jgi:hypothetical protein
MAVRLSALRAGRPLPPWRFLIFISVRGWVDPRAIVRLEWLSKLKKISNFIGNRTHDLSVEAHCLNKLRYGVPPVKVTWLLFWVPALLDPLERYSLDHWTLRPQLAREPSCLAPDIGNKSTCRNDVSGWTVSKLTAVFTLTQYGQTHFRVWHN